MQKILKKYEPKGFAILSINIVTTQDDQVVPMMKDYGFTLLKIPTSTWSKDEYNVTAAPTNYLLSADGRIIFKPRAHDAETQKMFEQEIDTLLEQAAQTSASGVKAKAKGGN